MSAQRNNIKATGTVKDAAETSTGELRLPPADGLFKVGLIPDWLERVYFFFVNPIIAFLSARSVNPNWLSTAGFVMIAAAGCLLALGWFYRALLLVLLGGLCDSIDGKVAAKANRVTRFGAIYDSVLDRYSDMAVFIALAIHFHRQANTVSALVCIIALAGGFMTSYVKAIGKSHGLDCRVGILRRQERMAVISIVLAFSFLDPYLKEWLARRWTSATEWPNLVVVAGVWFLAIFSNVTAIQRFLKLREMSGPK